MEYLLWVVVALVAYSLTAPLASDITRDVPSVPALFLSTGVFLAIAAVVLVATGPLDLSYATAPAAGYVYVGGAFLTVGILAYVSALEAGPVSVVVPIYGLFIVGSTVVGIVFLNESLTPLRVAGVGCAVVAVYLTAEGED